jgi:CDP-2,3-bis-(O-geranylgeranyl)-sn-glycerol synthase
MELLRAAELLILIAVANGAPVLATRLLGDRLAWPIDGSIVLGDGQRLLGPSKTIRGLIVALASTGLVSALLGFGWQAGFILGGLAMLGDVAASFLKRRLGHAPSSPVPGIDQIPESLLPALGAMALMDLSLADALAATAIFALAERPVSRLLYRLTIRKHPY